jgi:hypothetical protein
VPPYLRVVEASACEKGSKINSFLSGEMPIPVSITVKCNMPPFHRQHLFYFQGNFALGGEFDGVTTTFTMA